MPPSDAIAHPIALSVRFEPKNANQINMRIDGRANRPMLTK
jgi:hypothetical protein